MALIQSFLVTNDFDHYKLLSGHFCFFFWEQYINFINSIYYWLAILFFWHLIISVSYMIQVLSPCLKHSWKFFSQSLSPGFTLLTFFFAMQKPFFFKLHIISSVSSWDYFMWNFCLCVYLDAFSLAFFLGFKPKCLIHFKLIFYVGWNKILISLLWGLIMSFARIICWMGFFPPMCDFESLPNIRWQSVCFSRSSVL